MNFDRGLPSVEVLARIPAEELPWRREGVLVLVSQGLGALRWQLVEGEGGARRVLTLRETPLLFAQSSDEYWCPTCEKLLALGWGRDRVDAETLALIREASHAVQTPVHLLVDSIRAVLQLLEEGVYLVSRVPHWPTNGSSEPFWGLSTKLRPLEASKDFCYVELFETVESYPAFLLPTQPLDRCEHERVESYRKLAAQGHALGGLAFWGEGFLSALLDGHHRATAALLEHMPLSCLTIMSPTGRETGDGEKWVRLWDARVPYSSLPKHAVRVLETQTQVGAPVLSATGEVPETGAKLACDWTAMSAAAKGFPTARGLAAGAVAGDTSEERIDVLIGAGDSSAPRLLAILQALIGTRDPRATSLALRIGEGHWPELWMDAFLYLSTVRSQQVEEFFTEFVVTDEGLHPLLEEIAVDYLARDGLEEEAGEASP